jgi:hypothetical protein
MRWCATRRIRWRAFDLGVRMTTRLTSPWLRRYAAFLSLATFLLIIAGALVTSNDAGLSVPDWPTSFGTFRMPRMVGGVKFEHGHRMIAGTVSILTMVLALWLWRSEPRRWVRRLGALAVVTIIAQAVLGGITVLFYLPVAISVSHACLAQTFFCLTVSMALFTRCDCNGTSNAYRIPPRVRCANSPPAHQRQFSCNSSWAPRSVTEDSASTRILWGPWWSREASYGSWCGS